MTTKSISLLFAAALLILVATGCSKKTAPLPADSAAADPANQAAAPQKDKEEKAVLKADPNPVSAGTGFGTTTITWDTGNNEVGEVYVSTNGEAEKKFAEGESGTMPAPWIGAGGNYQFRLYAGKEHETVLETLIVTGTK